MKRTRGWVRMFLVFGIVVMCCDGGCFAQTPSLDDLPNCQRWSNSPSLFVSPAFAQDRVLVAWSGIPIIYDPTLRFHRSTNGGISWVALPVSQSVPLDDLAFSPDFRYDQSLYLAFLSSNDLLRSTDGGRSWNNVAGPSNDGFASLALVDAATVFLTRGRRGPFGSPEQGLFFTENAGKSWSQLYVGTVFDVAASPEYRNDGTILISIGAYHWNGGILRSTDRGQTWQPGREGLNWGSDGGVDLITFSPNYAEDLTVFCRSWGAPYKSTDGGGRWTRLYPWPEPTSYGSVGGMIVSPRYSEDHAIWISGGGAERQVVSTDAGVTWRPLSHGVAPLAAAPCAQQDSCRVVLFGYRWDGRHDYVYKSLDYGQTWRCLESPIPTTPPEIPEGSTLLLLGSGLAGLAGYGWWTRRAFSK